MGLSTVLYFSLLIAILVVGFAQRRILKSTDKVVIILIFLTLISELLGIFAAYVWKNNLFVYHFYNPLEFILITIYFTRNTKILKRRIIYRLLCIVGLIFTTFNSIFMQPIFEMNTYFLLYEGAVIIIFCLLSLQEILLDELNLPYQFLHFWLTALFLLYWSVTFTGWGIYCELTPDEFILNPIFSKILKFSNYGFYIGILLTFGMYKKFKVTDA